MVRKEVNEEMSFSVMSMIVQISRVWDIRENVVKTPNS